MTHYNLCLLGFGNVGQTLVRLLHQKSDEMRDQFGVTWTITGVATRRMGWLANPDGLDAEGLIAGRQVASITPAPDNVRDWLQAARADVLFENTSLNPQTGQPAIDYIKAALESGAHAFTANKGTVVHGYHELRDLAAKMDRKFYFESTVMDGIPIFSMFRSALPAAKVIGISGLLNSTTSVILSEIEQGKTLDEAIQTAQALGITETDPSADIDGWDATVKVVALANVLMGVPLKLDDVQREGIRGLTAEQVQSARAAGTPYKLVGRIEHVGDALIATVRPEQVSATGPLGAVTPEALVLQFEMDVIPSLTLTEENAGPLSTAYGLFADFLNAIRGY